MSELKSELRDHVRNLATSYPIIEYDRYGNKSCVGARKYLPADLVDAIIDCAVAEAVLKVAELMKQAQKEVFSDETLA